jgi:hypothetical protein
LKRLNAGPEGVLEDESTAGIVVEGFHRPRADVEEAVEDEESEKKKKKRKRDKDGEDDEARKERKKKKREKKLLANSTASESPAPALAEPAPAYALILRTSATPWTCTPCPFYCFKAPCSVLLFCRIRNPRDRLNIYIHCGHTSFDIHAYDAAYGRRRYP